MLPKLQDIYKCSKKGKEKSCDKTIGGNGNVSEVRKNVEIKNKFAFARDSLKNQKVSKT